MNAAVTVAGGDGGDDRDNDVEVMAWLGRLLEVPYREREAVLQALQQQRPDLLTRVLRMVEAAEIVGNTALIAKALTPSATTGAVLPGELHPGGLLGRYRLLRELGAGGMAVVWLALQDEQSMRRPVAIKVPTVHLDPAALGRFERERNMLAQLDHPGIAKLFDVGASQSGHPFLVLEYVRGLPLDEGCKEARSDVRERLEVFKRILEAVDHAHTREQKIVHRDLKPSNILMDPGGRIHLLDFGIAKLLDGAGGDAAKADLTRLNEGPGTTRYAAPEQLQNGTIDTPTDVYALGVVLFELLTGRSPYGALAGARDEAGRAELIRHILQVPAPRPSEAVIETFAVNEGRAQQLDPWCRLLRGDLDNIVLKALQKEPKERYASAGAMLADLRSFLEDRPVVARPPSRWRRLQLLVRRNRATSVAVGIGTAAVTTALVLLTFQYVQALEQRWRADAANEFMLDVMESVEPDETQTANDSVGREMVRASILRARARFQDQPRLRGEILGALARMLIRFDDANTAKGVLDEAERLLFAKAPFDDPARNKVQVMRASLLLDEGDVKAAEGRARDAYRACRQQTRECAKARAYAGVVIGTSERRAGRSDRAVETYRAALTDTQAGFGSGHAETAMAWHQLAVVLRETGQLQEAQQAMGTADAIASNTLMRLKDRNVLTRTRALLASDAGRFADSSAELRKLIPGTSDARELALQWRLVASAELAEGRPNAAIEAADRALAIREDANSVNALIAIQERARASSLMGECDGPAKDIEGALAGLRRQKFAEGSMPVLKAQRHAAEVLARCGHLDEALKLVDHLAGADAPGRNGNQLEAAQLFEVQGAILRALGQGNRSAASHSAAQAILAKTLPPDHVLLQRSRLYAKLGAAIRGGDEASRAAVAESAAAYLRNFSADSHWRLILQPVVQRQACPERREQEPDRCLVLL